MGNKKYFTEEERKEARREYNKRYNEKHPNGYKEAQKRWREKNPEKYKEGIKRWADEHPDRVRAKHLVQDYKKSDTNKGLGECTLTIDWIIDNIFNSKCYYCGADDWRKLGTDRIDNNLPHIPENVVPCCKSCNERRANMPFDEFVQRCKEAGEIVTYQNNPEFSKPCVAKDPVTLKVLYEFPSANEAERNGFHHQSVSRCCRGERKTYKGLIWCYVNE